MNRSGSGGRVWRLLLLLAALTLATLLRLADPSWLADFRLAGFDALQGAGGVGGRAPEAAIVSIDAASLDAHGPWPWSHDDLAEVVAAAQAAGARAVALNLLLTAPGSSAEPAAASPPVDGQAPLSAPPPADDPAETALAEALRAGRTAAATAVSVAPTPALERPPFALPVEGLITERRPAFEGVVAAHPQLRAAMTTEGAANLALDPDGVLRRAPLIFFVNGVAHPSLSVAVVAAAGLHGAVLGDDGRLVGLRLGERRVRTDAAGAAMLDFTRGASLPRVGAADLMAGRAGEALQGRIVVIGLGPAAAAQTLLAADGRTITGTEAAAVVVDALMAEAALARPADAFAQETVAMVVVGLGLALAWLWLPARNAASLALLAAAAAMLAALVLRVAFGLVYDAATPAAAWLAVSCLGAAIRRGPAGADDQRAGEAKG